jgi:hypothetical protein
MFRAFLTDMLLSFQGKSDALKAKLYGKYGKLVRQACDPTIPFCFNIDLQSYDCVQAGYSSELCRVLYGRLA